jgi:hypothetical protein
MSIAQLIIHRTEQAMPGGFPISMYPCNIHVFNACMEVAQQRYKQYTDSGRIDVRIDIRDEVVVSTKNLKLTATKKLSARYIGTFEMVTYELLPLMYGKLHHVSIQAGLLKPFKSDPARPDRAVQPGPVDEVAYTSGTRLEVERILDHGYKRGKGRRPSLRC